MHAVEQPTVRKNGWAHTTSPQVEPFGQSLIDESLKLLARWKDVFPLANTWVGKCYGVPSIIVRLDCVRTPDGSLGLYEVEERPCGIGLLSHDSPQFAAHLARLRKKWPPIRSVKDDTRVTDDTDWLGPELSLSEALLSDDFLMVRSRPEHLEYHELEPRSVSTVSCEGDKSYGEALGFWEELKLQSNPDYSPMSGEQPYLLSRPLTCASVLKPRQGTRCRDVLVYFPPGAPKHRPIGRNEAASLGEVMKMLRRHGGMYRQNFLPPMMLTHQENRNSIYRFYFGYDPDLKQYVPMGGVWMSRPALRVHGHSDAVVGLMTFAE